MNVLAQFVLYLQDILVSGIFFWPCHKLFEIQEATCFIIDGYDLVDDMVGRLTTKQVFIGSYMFDDHRQY